MKRITTFVLLISTLSIAALAGENHKALKKLDEKTFTKEIWNFKKGKSFKYKGDAPIVIDFNAVWCGPCKAIHPSLVELQEEYGDKITIYSVDVDQEPEITEAFGITNIPCLIFIKDKKTPYYKSVGKKSKEELHEMIEKKLLKE